MRSRNSESKVYRGNNRPNLEQPTNQEAKKGKIPRPALRLQRKKWKASRNSTKTKLETRDLCAVMGAAGERTLVPREGPWPRLANWYVR